MKIWWKSFSLINFVSSMAIDLPVSVNISRYWNFGFLLFVVLMIQVFTGVLVTMVYSAEMSSVFFTLMWVDSDVGFGWLVRMVHVVGASVFFVVGYVHMFRGLYYKSYKMKKVWGSGVLLLLVLMGVAFFGYVLPWGQMSYWGATVITNLISVIPMIGADMVCLVWGSYSVSGVTLMRFFVFHFFFAFLMVFFSGVHVLVLHEKGSSNPSGLSCLGSKVSFYPFSLIADLEFFFLLCLFFWLFIYGGYVYLVEESDNFVEANSMVAPEHIQPEWYFLFAYAILRSVPNKVGGVVALGLSVLVLYSMQLNLGSFSFKHVLFWGKLSFFWFIMVVFCLSWLGASPVESPFLEVSQMFSFFYFMYWGLLSFVF